MSQIRYPADVRKVLLPAQVDPDGKLAARSMTLIYGPLLTAKNRSSGLGGVCTGPDPKRATRISPDVPQRLVEVLPKRMLTELGEVVGLVTLVVASVEPLCVIPGFNGNGPMVQVDCLVPEKTVVLLVRELAVR
jgi:hypothetical protein